MSAPSGTGKTTLCTRLLKRHPELRISISTTTRPMRGEEVDGVDYDFTTVEAFKELLAADAFV